MPSPSSDATRAVNSSAKSRRASGRRIAGRGNLGMDGTVPADRGASAIAAQKGRERSRDAGRAAYARRLMLRVRLLGELALEVDGEELEAPASRRARALLGWLALHPGPRPRAEVAARFW